MAVDTRHRAVFLLLRRMRTPLLVLIVAYAVSVLGLVLMPGLDAEGRPYRMDFLHAFYVVSYTVTTIGFGELPYAFSAAQRLWVVFTIYFGVVAWIYAIGTLLALLQDRAFQQVLRENRFVAAVRRKTEPFYIVCGYGDTGATVVREMIEHGLSAVAIDIDPERINELTLEDLRTYVPGLTGDAAVPRNLQLAGLLHPRCAGVVALTNSDAVNLKVAITVKLLRPECRVICRAESHDTQANMESFGTDASINPFDAFAERLATALHAPDLHLLTEWLTQPPGRPLPIRYRPPRGMWVLCGYGRFGKAVKRHLDHEGIETTIIEATPERVGAPPGTVHGRGTEAVTLREARIEQAVGIVAGTDDDANNLSIVMTARDLNPNLFRVARQNNRDNDGIFAAARLDLVMQRSGVLANRVLALISTPLLTDFLRAARHQSEDWAQHLVELLWPLAANETPDLWTVTIVPGESPALSTALQNGEAVTLGRLLADPGDRREHLKAIPLLHVRGAQRQLLPDEKTELAVGDRLLFCGRVGVEARMQWALNNAHTLRYLCTGEVGPEGAVWRWLRRCRPAVSPAE